MTYIFKALIIALLSVSSVNATDNLSTARELKQSVAQMDAKEYANNMLETLVKKHNPKNDHDYNLLVKYTACFIKQSFGSINNMSLNDLAKLIEEQGGTDQVGNYLGMKADQSCHNKITGQDATDTKTQQLAKLIKENGKLEAMRQVINEVNKLAPLRIDKDTLLLTVTLIPPNTIRYYCEVSSISYEQVQNNDAYTIGLLEFMDKRVKNQACTNEDALMFLENDINISYAYASSSGKSLHRHTLGIGDCN